MDENRVAFGTIYLVIGVGYAIYIVVKELNDIREEEGSGTAFSMGFIFMMTALPLMVALFWPVFVFLNWHAREKKNERAETNRKIAMMKAELRAEYEQKGTRKSTSPFIDWEKPDRLQ
ncbi:MAG: hypothetical protein AAB605_01725 [Patescibacteria group bacterium]